MLGYPSSTGDDYISYKHLTLELMIKASVLITYSPTYINSFFEKFPLIIDLFYATAKLAQLVRFLFCSYKGLGSILALPKY